uniref:Ig-like domain-containing protein n=1 Tax=Anabas testudineus TaxID=64144 RepID=A0A7N6AEQ7_ANATE
ENIHNSMEATPHLCPLQTLQQSESETKLPKPSIYIHPAGEVTLGQNISIICSISTPTLQLLHGTFTLNQISGSFSQNQTSKTNCATFTIIKVNSHNEGLYSCRFFQGPQDFAVSDSVGLSVVDKKGKKTIVKGFTSNLIEHRGLSCC